MDLAVITRRTLSRLILLLSLALPTVAQDDMMTELVLPANPHSPTEFIELLREKAVPLSLHQVANRGACNPAKGSFSIFGDVGPQLTFGVFVEPNEKGELELQESFKTRLLIEVISLDKVTGEKNFWELIGNGTTSDWHYRGNSSDVVADIDTINMGVNSAPEFGARLRCSGCHTGGDLVMKEMFPYNDWKTDKPLALGPWKESAAVRELFAETKPAHHLNELVVESLRKHVKTLESRSPESKKQWMRSVLAPLEMNLVSDSKRFEQRQKEQSAVEIPAAFFVDPLLTGPQEPIKVPVALYTEALQSLGSQFAADESSGLLETEHAFVVPVRSQFDTFRIESLLQRGFLDKDLLSDLLSVDFRTAIYSQERLELMTLLPDDWESAEELRAQIAEHLEHQGGRGHEYQQQRALEFLAICRSKAGSVEQVKDWIRLAAQRRVEIQAAQTSQNPRGTILEGGLGSDGFRRIFPSYSEFTPLPYQYRLDDFGLLRSGLALEKPGN